MLIIDLTAQSKPDCATRRRQRSKKQVKLERDIQIFFQQAGVKTVNLDEMFQGFEWLA